LGGLGIANVQVNHIVESDLQRAELLAFPLLFLLSLLFFRSLVAALLPLLVGGLAIVATFLVLRLASELGSVSVFALNLTTSMGIGGASVALIAAAIALVVLPAVLALLGERVNSLAPRRLQRAANRDARPATAGAWYRLSRFVMRRPGRVAIASAVVMVALGI